MMTREQFDRNFQRVVMTAVLIAAALVAWKEVAQLTAPSIERPGAVKVGDSVYTPTPAPQLLAIERSTCAYCQNLKPTLAKLVMEARTAGVQVGWRGTAGLGESEKNFAMESGFLPNEIAAHDQKVLKINSVPLVVLAAKNRVYWAHSGADVTDADIAEFRKALGRMKS